MKKLIFLICIFCNIQAIAQPSTATWNTFLTSYKKDTTDRGVAQRKLQKDVASALFEIDKIKANDTLYIDTTKLAYINSRLTVIATIISPKLLDSLRLTFKDIPQLYKNDQDETKARSDSDKVGFNRWRLTDSLTQQNNGALRGVSSQNKLLNIRVDSLSLALIPINTSIKDLNAADKLTVEQLKSLVDKCEALKNEDVEIRKIIPKDVKLSF